MKVRILRSHRGEVDGIPLERFVVGRVYDVPASLATYLIVERVAAAESDSEPALVVPLEGAESDQSTHRVEQKTGERRPRHSMDGSR